RRVRRIYSQRDRTLVQGLQGQRQYQAGLTSLAAREGRSARAISATRAVMILVSRSSFFAQARPLQARQNLVAEEWKLVEIIDKRYRDPRQPRLAEIDELARNIGLGLAADALHVEIFAFEIEVLLVRPDQLDDVDPLLRVFVARFMIALLDAEHREFALVPPDHDVEAEPAFPHVVGGHHFLGGNDRVDH